MRIETKIKEDLSVLSKIEESHLSEHERQLTHDALDHANLFVDGVLWTMEKIEHLGDHLFGAPTRH